MTSTGHVRQTPAPTAAEWDDAPILKPESAFFDIQAQTISNGIDEELKVGRYSIIFRYVLRILLFSRKSRNDDGMPVGKK